MIFVPASFTMPTRKDHWEPLLRAQSHRERLLIVAPGQIERNRLWLMATACRRSVGGKIIARAKGCTWDHICEEIDLDYLDQIRKQIPSLENRRTDLYDVEDKIIVNRRGIRMDALQAIKGRKSYRSTFKRKPIPWEDLREIVEAGFLAPSGCNLQTTKFIAVDDPELVKNWRRFTGMIERRQLPRQFFC